MVKKVLLAAKISDSFRQLLIDKGYSLVDYKGSNVPTEIHGIVTSNKLRLHESELTPLQNLKWIARLGSGVEIIDTDYCQEHNIAFASSPAGIANAVGEHCVAMLVGLQKNIATSFSEIKNKQWIREPNRGWEIAGSTIGLIGYGHTGQAFAKKIQGFDCAVIAYDKYKSNFGTEHVKEVTLRELQEKSDVISFHVPANQETYHYYNDDFVKACKPHILMNTSRGDVVSTPSLLDGFEQKKVKGAALDVIQHEHLLADAQHEHWHVIEQLLKFNTIITPHIAGYSHDAIEKMSAELMKKLTKVI